MDDPKTLDEGLVARHSLTVATSLNEQRRTQALELACVTVQSSQATEQATHQIIRRAKAFEKYLQTGGQ